MWPLNKNKFDSSQVKSRWNFAKPRLLTMFLPKLEGLQPLIATIWLMHQHFGLFPQFKNQHETSVFLAFPTF